MKIGDLVTVKRDMHGDIGIVIDLNYLGDKAKIIWDDLSIYWEPSRALEVLCK